MHGTNPVYKPSTISSRTCQFTETFPTVQGEGPFAGYPAFFIRLSHCNLRCYFCDTDFSEQHEMWIKGYWIKRASGARIVAAAI